MSPTHPAWFTLVMVFQRDHCVKLLLTEPNAGQSQRPQSVQRVCTCWCLLGRHMITTNGLNNARGQITLCRRWEKNLQSHFVKSIWSSPFITGPPPSAWSLGEALQASLPLASRSRKKGCFAAAKAINSTIKIRDHNQLFSAYVKKKKNKKTKRFWHWIC